MALDLNTRFEAACMVSETMRVLQKSGSNVVAEILATTEEFVEWEHVPEHDIQDTNSHSQFFYHTHPKSDDADGPHDDEHGHFHTFLRGPTFVDECEAVIGGEDDQTNDIAHIIGIAMDSMGVPFRLFTVNQWVTGDAWYSADDLIRHLDRFEIDSTNPSWPLNVWITNMMRLFRPEIERLLIERDQTIEHWRKAHPDTNVYDNQELEVTSFFNFNLADYVDALEASLDMQ